MGSCCEAETGLDDNDLDDTTKTKDYKILFLGSGGSGKSTLFRQLKKMYGSGFTPQDKKSAASDIASFVIETMQLLIDDEKFGFDDLEDEDIKAAAKRIKSLAGTSQNLTLDTVTTASIKLLWQQPNVKALFNETSKLYLNGPCAHFFDSLDRISSPNYDPTDNDILMRRQPTVGVNEQIILKPELDGVRFRTVDVGGQRNERKKWIHQFENFSAIVYVISLSAFDEPLFEYETVNSLHDAIDLFRDTINNDSHWFNNSSLFLVFNKKDLFQRKIVHKSLLSCFADSYDEENYFEQLTTDEQKVSENIEFIKQQFLNQMEDQTKQVVCYETCAYDEEQVKKAFNEIFSTIVQRSRTAPV
eukprot:CAMPEP_0202693490 /NCGR_PEP_ID=MMETSP1385-20130828/7592_1 /ASSEMBLY_ACC=CAM_ASM_000861 /TAXON_ID=933848 /ORGANISM="Elphidium margaritaceum" /LENGTH=358 /DNA_ID=CAMNT_0049349171 /DNA_START=41 /DNA_END=1117 /DNA_ORIENTATION=-